MFLNYKRIPLAYIVLSILTLGYYSVVYRRDAVRDLNIAFGEKRVEMPDGKFVLLHYLTFGIYTLLWDLQFLKVCDEYLQINGGEDTIDYESYRFMGVIPLVRFLVVKDFVAHINEACRIYSENQLRDIDTSDITGVSRVREVNIDDVYHSERPQRVVEYDFISEKEEEKKHTETKEDETNTVSTQSDTRMVAGYAVVEEYDPSVDYRRIGYKLRFEREDKIAEKEEEERKKAEQEELNKRLAEQKPDFIEIIECHRNKRWLAKTVCLMLLVFIVPFALVAATIFSLPPVYDETYLGALNVKYEALKADTSKNKIVIIGGDSVALGIDSERMESELDYRVVNFGMGSGISMKMLMDLSRSSINEGDIIIIAPEMTEESMSLGFDGEKALEALDGNIGMLMQLQSENYSSLLGASLQFASKKIGYIANGQKPSTSRAVYRYENINTENGDNVYPRAYNETFGSYSKVNFDMRAKMNDSEVTEYEKFIEYVNDYTFYAQRKGAQVYFSFSPVCSAAISSESTEKVIEVFYNNLCDVLKCKIISDIKNYIMDEGYFYDNEFNLNDSGVAARTLKLIDDIKREQLDGSRNSELTKDASGYATPPVTIESQADIANSENFEFRLFTLKSGKEYVSYYAVSGVSIKGTKSDTLTVPNMYNGIPVVQIDAYAFKNAPYLRTVELSSNVMVIDINAFSESNVEKVFFANGTEPTKIYIGADFSAVDENGEPTVKFYVDAEKIELFKNDRYLWGKFEKYFEKKQQN